MAKTVVGSFDSYDEAERVVEDLTKAGFSRNDISIVANEASRLAEPMTSDAGAIPATEGPTTTAAATSGAATGAVAGGIVGGAAGLVASVAGLAIPGIGPIIAAGPIVAALSGAGVGAVAGGLLGALTKSGVPEADAHYYAESVRRGGALVTMRVDDEARADEAAAIFRRHGAVDIENRAAEWRRSGWTAHDAAAAPYTRQQIDEERNLWRDDDWTRYDSEFRREHEARGASVSSAMMGGYDEYSPAYRYGYDAAREGRYQGRAWDDIEADVRDDWQNRYPDRPWNSFGSAVRRGWERTKDAVERAIPGDSDRDGR